MTSKTKAKHWIIWALATAIFRNVSGVFRILFIRWWWISMDMFGSVPFFLWGTCDNYEWSFTKSSIENIGGSKNWTYPQPNSHFQRHFVAGASTSSLMMSGVPFYLLSLTAKHHEDLTPPTMSWVNRLTTTHIWNHRMVVFSIWGRDYSCESIAFCIVSIPALDARLL